MANAPPDSVVRPLQCPCGVQYPWRRQDAGHELRCVCGRLLQIPSTPPLRNPTPLVELPNIHDRRMRATRIACPVCCTPLNPHDKVCLVCGFDRREGRRVHVQQDRPLTQLELDLAAEAERETRYLRIACIVALGVALFIALLVRPFATEMVSLTRTATMFLPWTIISTLAMLGALWLTFRWLDLQIDDLLTVGLAVAAIAADTFQIRALILELLHVTQPTDIVTGGIMVVAVAFGVVLTPLAIVYLLVSFLLRPEHFSRYPMTLALCSAETVTFVLLAAFAHVPW